MVTDTRLLMICPSRGRPRNIEALWDAWQATTGPEATLLVVVDEDDPELAEYQQVHQAACDSVDDDSGIRFLLLVSPRLRLGGTLNVVARHQVGLVPNCGFLGDDHRPRTDGWALRLIDELERLGTGIVYGDDLIHGAALPTAAAMTTDIVQALGYMVPAGLVHMWIDNAWKAWGEGMGRLSYLPGVVIEHVHPLVGKAPTDDLYAETGAMMGPDGERWNDYRLMGGLGVDVERLRELVRAKDAAR